MKSYFHLPLKNHVKPEEIFHSALLREFALNKINLENLIYFSQKMVVYAVRMTLSEGIYNNLDHENCLKVQIRTVIYNFQTIILFKVPKSWNSLERRGGGRGEKFQRRIHNLILNDFKTGILGPLYSDEEIV